MDVEQRRAPAPSSSTPVPELVPVRMLNEFTYCPRLAYLEWVQGEFEDNADTIQGRSRHRRVDREVGGADDPEKSAPDDPVLSRSLMLSASKEGLIARMDIVQFDGTKATPIDYKRGRVPDILEKVWEPERVQLCAQGLILRENGYECDEGIVYFVESRTRVTVPFDDALIARTRSLLARLRQTAAQGQMPPPLQDSPKCPRCSLVGICLPDETWLLKQLEGDEAASGRKTAFAAERPNKIRRLIPKRDDALPLYVQEQGARVGKSGNTLTVKRRGELLHEVRMLDVSQLCLLGNVQVSTQAVRELAAHNIPILYFTYGGWLSAMTGGPHHKNVELRMAQYAVAADPARSLPIARHIVAGKIFNSRTLLRRNHKGKPDAALAELRRLRSKALHAPRIEALLGIEGAAARVYFSQLHGMLRSELGAEWDFRGRNRRPPRDPINALLSFAYALVIKDAQAALSGAGFDPYLGVYHAPKYGKPALALDLAEEFRPLIADSTVVRAINNEEVTADDFVRRSGGVALKDAARRRFIAAYERRMQTTVTHPLFGYTVSYRRIMAVQARLLARTITGEIKQYPAFVTR